MVPAAPARPAVAVRLAAPPLALVLHTVLAWREQLQQTAATALLTVAAVAVLAAARHEGAAAVGAAAAAGAVRVQPAAPHLILHHSPLAPHQNSPHSERLLATFCYEVVTKIYRAVTVEC